MAWSVRLAAALAALTILAACGARTEPKVFPNGDAGLDGMVDGMVDAEPDGGSLMVDCGRSTQFTTIRRPITLEGRAESPDPIVRMGWTLIAVPGGSLSTAAPLTGPTTTITPDRVGDYRLLFEARDGGGRAATCEVTVESIVGPPRAICPEDELLAGVGETVVVPGAGFDDDGVLTFSWRVVAEPRRGAGTLTPETVATPNFIGTAPGTYTLELTVVDIDGASDQCTTAVRVIAPPVVECPSDVIRAPTRQPVRVRAGFTDDLPGVTVAWEMLSRPADSDAALSPLDEVETRFTPDEQGRYTLEFTATDSDGLSASCTVQVQGTPTPPDAICVDVETTPLVEVEVPGDAVDDGEIVSWSWRLIDGPLGSAAGPPSPPNSQVTRFLPDIAGEYALELTVTDDDGDSASCVSLVAAVVTEGLRVEMFWDSPRSDMDLHLLHPEATAWQGPLDCHYANCKDGEAVLPWFTPAREDDPILDLDDLSGFGPENINIDVPARGTYRVGVHAFSGRGRVTVRVYCGGSTTEPRATFGPTFIESGRADLWRVADVQISGSMCTITDLTGADGRANIGNIESGR